MLLTGLRKWQLLGAYTDLPSGVPMDFNEILPLFKDVWQDRIWQFIATIFLAHAGVVGT